MFYRFSDTIPANTSKANARKTVLELAVGRIHRVEIEFPAGCCGLAHLTVCRGLHQVWPTNPEADLASDDYIIPWNEDEPVELGDHWYMLTWNEDDTYEHTLTLRLGILRPEEAPKVPPTETILQRLRKLFQY